jgi:fluoride exporter
MMRYGVELLGGGFLFPLSTLCINIIGCFLLEIVYTYLRRLPRFSPRIISGLGVGFIGAFTTLSAFYSESIGLITTGNVVLALFYLFATVIGGVLATVAGLWCANHLRQKRVDKRREAIPGDADA